MATSSRRSPVPVAVVALMVALGGALGACAAAPSAPSAPSDRPSTSRPAIADPLDLRGRDACALLAPDALERLSLRPEPVDRGASPTTSRCTWRSLDDAADLTLVIDTARGLGPDWVGPTIEQHVPESVGGFPAERIDPLDAPTCRIVVGVAETQSLAAEAAERTTQLPDQPSTRPCALARRLAETTLTA